MKPEQVPAPVDAIVHLEPEFDPERPPRSQLSAMVERLVEFERGSSTVRVGWCPERSPGGAFRVEVDDREAWFDAWSEVEAALRSGA